MQRPNHEPRRAFRGAGALARLEPRRRPVVGTAGFGKDAGDAAVSAAFGILSGLLPPRPKEDGIRKMGGESVSRFQECESVGQKKKAVAVRRGVMRGYW